MNNMTAMARLVLLSLLFLSASAAYTQTVRLSGKITNQRNEPIPGASVIIEGTTTGSPANAEGRFTISLEVGKKYTLVVSATGYTTKAVADVEVSATLENNVDIVLEESKKNELGGVVVRTTRRQESTNALLAFQKNNTALSSGIAADFIRRTPDKNTGEVLRRVSGTSIQDNKFVVIRGLSDRYNSAFINGAQLPSSEPDKKAFSFDVIPSQLIDNIIINKTATPDLTGEFAGGLVQVVTKDIPSNSQLIVGISQGFNTQSAFKDFVSNERGQNDWLGFSDRKLPGAYPKHYGDYNRLNTGERIEVSKAFRDDVYRQVQSTAGPIQQYNITWANVMKGKKNSSFGSIIGITYRNSKQLYDATRYLPGYFDYSDAQNKYSVNWGAVANFAWTKGKHKIAFKNLFNQLLDDNYYVRSGLSLDNIQDISLRSSVLNQRSLYSSQLEGTHTFFKREIKLTWNLNYSYNDKQQPDLRVQTYTRSTGTNDPFSLNLRGNNTNRFFSNLTDHAFGYNASLAIPFTMGAHKQTLKVGGAATVRLRDFRAIILGLREPTDASLTHLPYDQAFNKNNFRTDGFYFTTELQNPSDRYYGVSALSAGYIMFDNKLNDRFRLVWGTRFENFEQFLKSNVSTSDKASIVDSDKFDVLPSVNLTFSPNNKTNFRVAASRTVARPEFREIASFAFFDFETIASTAGTDSLKRSSIINGDIRYEYYPKPGEVLSLGAFYKNFTDPIELRLNEASGGSRRQYEFQNAEKATLFGVEAEFRKSLAFLGKKDWLNNLYFNGNVSVIFSEVTLGNFDASGNKLAATDRPLQGQSPYLINAGFTYDGATGTNVSLLYNRIGPRLSLVGNTQFPDIYEKSRDLVDFQVSQKIFKKKGEIRLTVGDILNQQVATYQNKDDKKGFKEGTDIIFSSYKQGTTFTLGFIYNLDLKK
jgi:hypothetical protein